MSLSIAEIRSYLGGPLAAFWVGGAGPTRSSVETVIRSARIDVSAHAAANKADLVLAGFAAAESRDQIRRLVQGLVELLRFSDCLEFGESRSGEPWNGRESAEERAHLSRRTAALKEAMHDLGGELTPRGLLRWPDEPMEPQGAATLAGTGTREHLSNGEETVDEPGSRKLFLVHGRDDQRRHEVTTHLFHAGLQPTVLQEEPSGGKTIIEKFEIEAARHGHVVVLATGDDLGALAPAGYRPEDHGWVNDPFLSGLRLRPRQNVVLELGYFYARLGREHVTIVTERGVELPSDLHGVGVVYFDDEWRYRLNQELKAAGLPVA